MPLIFLFCQTALSSCSLKIAKRGRVGRVNNHDKCTFQIVNGGVICYINQCIVGRVPSLNGFCLITLCYVRREFFHFNYYSTL